jgi:DNA modification methylase
MKLEHYLYYQDDWATIYHGDCLEIMTLLDPVDLVVTDPPYGIDTNTNTRRFGGGKEPSRRGGRSSPRIVDDDKPFDPSLLLELSTDQIIWGWNNFAHKLPPGTCLVWIKRNDEAFGSFLSDAEIAWMSKGHGVYCKKDLSNNAIANRRVHPTQKPENLMRWCLLFFPKSALVLDPYMGSGTTCVAAKNLNRKSIGIEINPDYCEIAVKRLRQEVFDFSGGKG